MGNFNSMVFPLPVPPCYSNTDERLRWITRKDYRRLVDKNRKIKEGKIPIMLHHSPYNTNKLIIYFHGNASDLGKSSSFCSSIAERLNMHVVAVEYPGYGFYDGFKPHENIILEDSIIIYDLLVHQIGIQHTNIIVFGRSIGSGPAIHLAANRQVGALLLFSPIMSIRDVVKEKFGALNLVVKNKFHNCKKIKTVKSPILFLHGRLDKVVSFNQSLKMSMEAKCSTYVETYIGEEMTHSLYHLKNDLVTPCLNFLEANGLLPGQSSGTISLSILDEFKP